MGRWWPCVLLIMLVGCGSGQGDNRAAAPTVQQPVTSAQAAPGITSTSGAAAPTTPTTRAAATTAPQGCLAVSGAFVDSLGITLASAVKETVNAKPGLNRRGMVWFVSTRTGATWVTSADPTTGESGLTLPLNSQARAESQAGTDVAAGAPVFEGFTDASPAAVRSRSCAGV